MHTVRYVTLCGIRVGKPRGKVGKQSACGFPASNTPARARDGLFKAFNDAMQNTFVCLWTVIRIISCAPYRTVRVTRRPNYGEVYAHSSTIRSNGVRSARHSWAVSPRSTERGSLSHALPSTCGARGRPHTSASPFRQAAAATLPRVKEPTPCEGGSRIEGGRGVAPTRPRTRRVDSDRAHSEHGKFRCHHGVVSALSPGRGAVRAARHSRWQRRRSSHG